MNIRELYHKYKERIPSWLWLLIMLFGLILIILVPIAFIYVVSHFEGVASILFLVIGWFAFGSFAKQEKRNPFILGGAVLFFALMGMAVDQPGNYIYNRPLAFACPEGTTFNRSVMTRNPLPERTDFVQRYQCFSEEGGAAYSIPMYIVVITRFGEYIIIAYLLLAVRLVITKVRSRIKNGQGDTA